MRNNLQSNQLPTVRKIIEGMKGHNYALPDCLKFILNKSLLSIFVYFILLIFCTSCERIITNNDDNATETTAINITTLSAVDSEIAQYITTLIEESDKYDFIDDNGVRVLVDYSIRIPELHISDELNTMFAADIDALFYGKAKKQIGEQIAVLNISYSAYINGDILSVIITQHSGFSAGNIRYYFANFNVINKSIVRLPSVLKERGFEPFEVLDMLENPDVDNFYINANGELIIVEQRYWEATGDSYYRSYNIDTSVVHDPYFGS